MKKNTPSLPSSFEAAVVELEALVAKMESGQMSLEESLIAYKRGKELERFCAKQLDAVQEQLKILEQDELKPLKLAALESGET
ncbi:MAG: exodeoxyribonuclease VII small subunit [Burkholderiaceae bacterium]|nr:exodeoxyribonuclease VII small subunit [Burkholderiaceae bacterium]